MTPLKIAPLPGCTPGTAEKIDALNRKLGSFIHAPLNLKEILRMEPFAADGEVVRAVAASLDDYAILPTSPEERERQRTTPVSTRSGYNMPAARMRRVWLLSGRS